MPTEIMAGMATKREESENERSAEMDAAAELVRLAKQHCSKPHETPRANWRLRSISTWTSI
ncbi:hypothetical protein BAQU_1842 [Bifidobacterium aquikefiri]|uniref:Uncharacterized protein n=1 Tax=Bifidobacterium aquikefiri TaxID=1653207 RepID=A0A261G0Z1_9BIFI|nr:hypothetical protein BAQU_1842 [Bifidobacterium aquikefiri]